MGNFKPLKSFIFVLALLTGCAPKVNRYLTELAPPPITTPTEIEVAVISPPPLVMRPNEFLTKSSIGSPLFKIAIPPCVDMTGKADHLKNSIADMFQTALFETKRFNLLDRLETIKAEKILLSEISKDTIRNNKNLQQREIELMDESTAAKQKMVAEMRKLSIDGILLVYITSDEKAGKEGKLRLDYRIVRHDTIDVSNPLVLFADYSFVNYKYDKSMSSLALDESDFARMASKIRDNFPNPDIHQNFRITNKRGDIITVNAGKKNNIVLGMLGFVIRLDKDQDGSAVTPSYRALFEVTEVYPESFTAKLLGERDEDAVILPTIKVGEPIRMK